MAIINDIAGAASAFFAAVAAVAAVVAVRQTTASARARYYYELLSAPALRQMQRLTETVGPELTIAMAGIRKAVEEGMAERDVDTLAFGTFDLFDSQLFPIKNELRRGATVWGDEALIRSLQESFDDLEDRIKDLLERRAPEQDLRAALEAGATKILDVTIRHDPAFRRSIRERARRRFRKLRP